VTGGGGSGWLGAVLNVLQLGESIRGNLYAYRGARQQARAAEKIAYQLLQTRRFAAQQQGALMEQQSTARTLYDQFEPILVGAGQVLLDVTAAAPDYAVLANKTRAQINANSKLRALAIARFGSVRGATQSLKGYRGPQPTQIGVPTVGVNAPATRGSREDPAGPIRPKFYARW
jgi:hypothetical protein